MVLNDDDDNNANNQEDERYRLDYFERLRANATNVERVGSVDVVTTGDGSQLGFCHFVHMIPLTWVDSDMVRKNFLTWQSQEQVAAMYLALRQLNTGDGSVVKEVEGLNERCNIRFTAELIDTELIQVSGVKGALHALRRKPVDDRLPCAFLGASRSAVSVPTSIITGIKGYPQFSSISTSPALNDKSQHRLFGRTIPSDDATAVPAIEYFTNELNVKHLCVLYANDPYGSGYARALQEQASYKGMKIVPVELPAIAATEEDYLVAVQILASTQYRYIFAIVFGEQVYNDLMTEAYRQGIAGPEYTWMFADAMGPEVITNQQFEPGSVLHNASKGISILKAEGGVSGMPGYDRFVKAHASLNNELDIGYMDSQFPHYEDDPTYEYTSLGVFLDQSIISATVSFIYDATIALGLAACNQSMNLGTNGNIAWEGGGEAHFHAVLDALPFEGASGNITFDPITGSRDPNSALYQLTNLVEDDDLDPMTGKVTFHARPSHRFLNGMWETITPYVFSDGTTNIPGDLPALEEDFKHIGTLLRSGGLLLSGIGMVMAIYFSLWTYRNRESKVVQVSQPIFLYTICFGNFLMAAAIIPLSFDDEIISTWGCNLTCMATFWLFWVGFAVAFSALFSKAWRLNKSYTTRKKVFSVQLKEVVRPLLGLVGINIFLLFVWTFVSPRQWERIPEHVDGFGRTTKSFGYCTSEYDFYFHVVFAVLNGGSLVISLYQVYRARRISNEFDETKYITAAIAGMLLVSFMGVPLMIIASDNPRSNYFVMSCIIFVTCTLFLLFIFVPKVRFHNKAVKGLKDERSALMEMSRRGIGLGGSGGRLTKTGSVTASDDLEDCENCIDGEGVGEGANRYDRWKSYDNESKDVYNGPPAVINLTRITETDSNDGACDE